MRTIFYYQTFTGLSPLFDYVSSGLCIIVSSIHFGKHSDGTPYIHLNNDEPDNPVYDVLWEELKEMSRRGATIMLMMGGAGGAYHELFSDFDCYYGLLDRLIQTHAFIDGIDLDVEEPTDIENIKKLITRLDYDFGFDFIITMAPVAYALQTDYPGMGGFLYKDLINTEEGSRLDWFNVQFYDSFSKEEYAKVIENGYRPSKVVMGMLGDVDMSKVLPEVHKCVTLYGTFGGVYVWEYFNSQPSPAEWLTKMEEMSDMYNFTLLGDL